MALALKRGQGVEKARILELAAGDGRKTSLLVLHNLKVFDVERAKTSDDLRKHY